MRYLLDTAAFSAYTLAPQILPARIRKLLDNAESKGLCSVSLLELAIHHRRGRLQLAGTLAEFFEAALAADIELLEISPAIAAASNDLPADFPGDPFDRAIAATARATKITLITPDKNIRDARFCAVEFYPFRPTRGSRP